MSLAIIIVNCSFWYKCDSLWDIFSSRLLISHICGWGGGASGPNITVGYRIKSDHFTHVIITFVIPFPIQLVVGAISSIPACTLVVSWQWTIFCKKTANHYIVNLCASNKTTTGARKWKSKRWPLLAWLISLTRLKSLPCKVIDINHYVIE